jgi:hypothetical protein
MNEDLLALLQEAAIEIEQMWKTCDKSVGDYVLSLETAHKFVQHALQTEDRLDIYKALQKAYDVLEKEEEEFDDEESEPSLASRISQAIGLDENLISESDLKKLTKFILSEIAPAKTKINSAEGLFSHLLDKLKSQQDSNPIANSASIAHNLGQTLISNLRESVKSLIGATTKNSKEGYAIAAQDLNYNRDDFFHLIVIWARKIDEADSSKREAVGRVMDDLRTHIIQIGKQTKLILDNIKQYGNYINAMKEMKHLNEIFAQMNRDLDELFKIALSVGLGTKGKKK